MPDDLRARPSVGDPMSPSEPDDEHIRREATDAFLRVQAGEIPLPEAEAATPPPPAANGTAALVPVSLFGRLRATARRWMAFGKPAFAVDPLWAEAFRLILPLGLIPDDTAAEIRASLLPTTTGGDSAARKLQQKTVGAHFPELVFGPAPFSSGAFSRSFLARRPNGSLLAVTLLPKDALADLAERHAGWRDSVAKWLRERGVAETETLEWLDFAVEYIGLNLDCRERSSALEHWRGEPYGKAALRGVPELTSEHAFAVTLPTEGLTAPPNLQTVNAMWRRFATHAFDHGLFQADLDTAHWRIVGDQPVYDGVEFVGRLTEAERLLWAKLLSRILARDPFGTNDTAAEHFPGLELSLAESHLRGQLDTALPASERLTRIVARILVEARRAGSRVSPGELALLHGLATLEGWTAAVAPTHDPLPMFFVELQEIQAKRIAATALVDGANVKQAAKDYFSLLRGSFKAGFGWLTGSRIPSTAVSPKEEPVTPKPVVPVLTAPQNVPSPPVRPGSAPNARSRKRNIGVLPFFQFGLVTLTILLFIRPNPGLAWHTAIGILPLDALLAFALCGASFFLARKPH
jgi:hypothetical protein